MAVGENTPSMPLHNGASASGAPSRYAVAAVDIGGTKIAGGLVVYDATFDRPLIVARCTVPTDPQRGGDAVLADVVTLVGDLLAEASNPNLPIAPLGEKPSLAPLPILGIGVSAAGSIRESDGSVAYANDLMPGWMGQPVGATLENAFGLPVAVLNDVRAHALGELRHGSAQGTQSCIMIAAGTGLAGAIIVNGRLLTGAHGFAGMLGHTLHPAALDVPSAWTTTGHLESVVAGSGIECCYRLGGGESVPGAEISRRALAGEPLARRVIEQSGRGLGEAIASWADIIDPELVIIAGSVCNAGELWRSALDDGLSARLASEFEGLPVVEALLGPDAPLIGAAEQLLDRINLS